jgi:uncharacterized membrane protein YGL010W
VSQRSKTVLRAAFKTLGLICFVLAALASLIFLTDLAGMMTTTGVWTHFGIPVGLFVLSWLFQHIGRRIP